jgi:protein AbiQ
VRHDLNGDCNEQEGRIRIRLSCSLERNFMDKLNFYTVDYEYVKFLQNAEQEQRGFSRVPNVEYSEKCKPKFLCGVVLLVNKMEYYVPVTSYKQQKPDNFLIKANNGNITSSLRFNYMFPIPKELITERTIAEEPDRTYRALLAQELRYCIANQNIIKYLAERTYKRVKLGLDKGLVTNSCAFKLLEVKCKEYQMYSTDLRIYPQNYET